MDTALAKYRDYTDTRFSKYDDYRAAVCDGMMEDDSHSEDGRQHYYALYHFRRCSLIIWHDSQGFQHTAEYPDADQAQTALDNVRDEYYNEIENAARNEYPDAWIVRMPDGYGYEVDAEHDSEEEAREELARIIRHARRLADGASIDLWRSGPASFECRDSEDATICNPMSGHYYIEHIDRSDDRERFIEMSY